MRIWCWARFNSKCCKVQSIWKVNVIDTYTPQHIKSWIFKYIIKVLNYFSDTWNINRIQWCLHNPNPVIQSRNFVKPEIFRTQNVRITEVFWILFNLNRFWISWNRSTCIQNFNAVTKFVAKLYIFNNKRKNEYLFKNHFFISLKF